MSVRRTWRGTLAWLVLVSLFPLTLVLASTLQDARTKREIAEYQVSLLTTVIEQFNSGVVIVNAGTGEIVTWNSGAELILGYRAQDVIGRNLLFIMPPDQQAKHADRIKDPGVKQQLKNTVLRITCWLITKEGKSVHVCINLRGVQDQYSDQYRFVLTFDPVRNIVPVELPGPAPTKQPPVDLRQYAIPSEPEAPS